MRLLVIEDNPDILANVVDFLEAAGHIVDCARNGPGGLHLALTGQYDLLVLDVMLPGMDGYQLCRSLRESGSQMPVIMLTARDTVDDRLHGLRTGADDYLVKPFALAELEARIEAVLRRTFGARQRLQVADLALDPDTWHVMRGGQTLRLSPACFKLLEILMRRSPGVVRRETLESALWGDDPPASDSLRSHLHLLRQAVDKPFPQPLLHTVHGVGYRLAEDDRDD
ncbi:MAG: response regulator transcription factor [Betaproteobacteria bacterium]|nr:response regulator transcription factor [Betaproteobacteria bacterium]MCL2885684.1 response regulator transcription factor [Betaproteobacteria bacterium]